MADTALDRKVDTRAVEGVEKIERKAQAWNYTNKSNYKKICTNLVVMKFIFKNNTTDSVPAAPGLSPIPAY